LRGYLETGNKKRKGPAADAGASVEAGGLIGGIDYENNAHGPNDVTGPLLKGSPTGGGHPLPAIAFRKSKRACSTTDNETWVPADASNTLNNFDLGDTRTTHAVVQPVAWTQNQREEVRLLGDKVGAIALQGTHQTNYIAEPKVYENHPNDSRVTGPLDVAPTVVSRFGTGGGNVPLVNNEAITFQPGNLRRDAGADPSTTTTTTLKASAGDQTPHVATAMAVRRLTPVECERLQGFPDNWSRISWKGKPEEQCPDGPRYKACGNSMAVPVMRWIGERITAVNATLPHNA
jgi:DNA (cytosine-5)-methyltransferase 1